MTKNERKLVHELLDALRAIEAWHRGYGTKTQAEIVADYVRPALAHAEAVLK